MSPPCLLFNCDAGGLRIRHSLYKGYGRYKDNGRSAPTFIPLHYLDCERKDQRNIHRIIRFMATEVSHCNDRFVMIAGLSGVWICARHLTYEWYQLTQVPTDKASFLSITVDELKLRTSDLQDPSRPTTSCTRLADSATVLLPTKVTVAAERIYIQFFTLAFIHESGLHTWRQELYSRFGTPE